MTLRSIVTEMVTQWLMYGNKGMRTVAWHSAGQGLLRLAEATPGCAALANLIRWEMDMELEPHPQAEAEDTRTGALGAALRFVSLDSDSE